MLNDSAKELQTIAESVTTDRCYQASQSYNIIAQSPDSGKFISTTNHLSIAPNTNHEKQPRLYQIKRRKTPTGRWAKPTITELTECELNLESRAINFCAVCFRDIPPNLPDEEEDIFLD